PVGAEGIAREPDFAVSALPYAPGPAHDRESQYDSRARFGAADRSIREWPQSCRAGCSCHSGFGSCDRRAVLHAKQHSAANNLCAQTRSYTVFVELDLTLG